MKPNWRFRSRLNEKAQFGQGVRMFIAALSVLFAAAHANAAQAADAVAVQEIGWVGVTQSDMTRSERFFEELLELDEYGRMDDLGLVIYQLPSGQLFELISAQAPDSEMYRRPLLGFLVEDAEKAKRIMEAKGLAF